MRLFSPVDLSATNTSSTAGPSCRLTNSKPTSVSPIWNGRFRLRAWTGCTTSCPNS